MANELPTGVQHIGPYVKGGDPEGLPTGHVNADDNVQGTRINANSFNMINNILETLRQDVGLEAGYELSEAIEVLINNAQSGKVSAIVNGNFSVNQLVKSGAIVLAADEYGHDMWKAGAGGCTYSVVNTNGKNIVTIQAGSLINTIKFDRVLHAGDYALAWEGTAEGRLIGGVYGGSPVVETLVGGVNVEVEFGVGTVSLVRLFRGSDSREFGLDDMQLALCQKHYFKSFMQNIAPASGLGFEGCFSNGPVSASAPQTHIAVNCPFPVTMDHAPAIVVFAPFIAGNGFRDGSGYLQPATVGFTNEDRSVLYNTNTGPAYATRFDIHLTAEARL